MKEKTKITYRQVNGFLIPNIILPPEQANIIIGKWGLMHKNYLEHNKRGIFMLMVTKCTLWPYLADIDRQANEMYDLLIEKIKEAEGVTEELKEQDQLEWVQKMGNIQQQARVLETSIDNILLGGERQLEYKGKITVSDMKAGLGCLRKMGECLGKENLIYRSAVEGINTKMNTDIENAFNDDYAFEAFVAEAVIQNLMQGLYVDISDIKNNFRHDHFKNIVVDFCKRYGIR